ncbi:MAG: nucleoside-diphosphate sugar epimerase/dehydratase [Snowella sp.]|nr:nucleoside-diphosphate sugar epimerase/dehydratase [Snowella sp.]
MKTLLAKILYNIYRSLARSYKRKLLLFVDACICVLAIVGAFFLRDSISLLSLNIDQYFWPILFLISVKLIIFKLKGMYNPILRYTGIEFLSTATQSILLSSTILIVFGFIQGSWPLPRTIVGIDALLTLVLIVTVRILIRYLFRILDQWVGESKSRQRVVIYGAGASGSQLARAFLDEPSYEVICFVDDNTELHRQVIQGFKVYSPTQLTSLYSKRPFDIVILAMYELSKTRKREIVQSLESLPITVKAVPPMAKLVSGEVSIGKLRNIDVTELLGREEVMPYPELLYINVAGKSVLVTGAGGSIGSELCRQIAQLNPTCLIMYEMSEFALYSIDIELAERFPHIQRAAYLGNVTEQLPFQNVLRKHQVNTIYHAAAYKHVPIVEDNPALGIYNNVQGTLSVAQAAIACDVSNVVLISTDKAVRPTNVMGASKRVAELVVQSLADLGNHSTCFTCVRFGNVLDSSGSVVPRFRRQIASGQPITVTHADVTRYFMSIPEAVRLVMQAGAMSKGGEVFLLDMGDPIRIYDLAVQMIRLSGLEPGRDIEIKITGLRPGEKLYEELLIDQTKAESTRHPRIFSAKEHKLSWDILEGKLERLLLQSQTYDYEALITTLKDLVQEYKPANQIVTKSNNTLNNDKTSIEL